MGFAGSERTTRRAVAEVRAAYRAGRRRVHRPWVVEPGLWFQCVSVQVIPQLEAEAFK